MKNFELLKGGLNTNQLLSRIESNPGLWNEIKLRQEFEGTPHKYTETIFIRWCRELDLVSAFNDLEAIDYPARAKLLEVDPLIEEIFKEIKFGKLGRVLITKLIPGGIISPHADEGIVCGSYERFHIPLYSKEGNKFFAGDPKGNFESVHMNAGDLWFFNNKEVHWLRNESSEPRIHLIVDAQAPQFRGDYH